MLALQRPVLAGGGGEDSECGEAFASEDLPLERLDGRLGAAVGLGIAGSALRATIAS